MIFNRERDACYGRSFASGHADEGFWENFADWVVRTPVATPSSKVSGGPGWYIIDDQSAASPDPYIVISNHAAANVAGPNIPSASGPNRYDEPHKILKCGYNNTEAGFLRVEAYLWWDATAHVGYGRWSSKSFSNYDAASFVYDFRGGPSMMCLATRLGSTWTNFMLTEWIGDANMVDGTHVVGVLQGGITAGTSVTIQLGTGQASNFTAGHYAYLYDFNGHDWIDYVKIDEVSTYNDTVTINQCSQNFPANSVIGAYVHRFCIGSVGTVKTNVGGWTYNDSVGGLIIPYFSRYGDEMKKGAGQISGKCLSDVLRYAIGEGTSVTETPGMAPNDREQYACQRPFIVENKSPSNSETNMNRAYGVISNVWITCTNNDLIMNDGRRINSLNHVYYYTANMISGPVSTDQKIVLPDYDSVV